MLPCAVIVSSLLALSAGSADVIYVDDSAIAGANDGTSWTNAFIDLQDALAIAHAGDEIRIGQGVYKPAPPNGDRTISFALVAGTVLRGGYAGVSATDPDANDPADFPTLLSGDLNANDTTAASTQTDNALHVVRALGNGRLMHVAGVTIEGGRATIGEDCSAPLESTSAAGLLCVNANLRLDDCVIRRNRAFCRGGGLFFEGGFGTFNRCRFEANSAALEFSAGGGAWGFGTLHFTDCEFAGNSAYYAGGATLGGAVFRRCAFRLNQAGESTAALGASDGALIDCLIEDNHSGTFLGGVRFNEGLIANCTFRKNTAICAIVAGTALRLEGNAFVFNSMFTGNHGQTIGVSGLANSFVNSTIVGSGGCTYGIWMSTNGVLQLRNSIVWQTHEPERPATQENQIFIHPSATISIAYSCIQGWTGSLGGIGNHGNDPRFVDADGPDNIYGTADDDVRLRANSPCIDSGNAALLPPDQFDLDEDGDTTEPLPIDLDGLPRVVGSSLDAGAFEFQGMPCRADITGDGSVNVSDLLAVISGWGLCIAGQTCPADLDLSGQISVSDLLTVIFQWGACP